MKDMPENKPQKFIIRTVEQKQQAPQVEIILA